jgi:hypothetical protein
VKVYQKKSFDETNRGTLFREERPKEGPTDRDYSGSINIGGTEFWLSGWIKESKKTGKKFLSLSVKPKNEQTKTKSAAPFDDALEF